jgi:hypothetical protein
MSPNPQMEILEPPAATRTGSSLQISFTVAFFLTGDQTILTPEVDLVSPDGDVRQIPGEELTVTLRSVLPAGDSVPEVKPGFDPIARPLQRMEPLVYLELVVVFFAFIWWVVRMRPPLPQPIRSYDEVEARAPLASWAATGEVGAVSEVAHRRLKDFLGRLTEQPVTASTTAEILNGLEPRASELPMREISELLTRLDRVAFAPTHGDEVIHLAEQVDDLISELEENETPEVVH